MAQDLRVAISQRICPPWRVPFFRELARCPSIDLTVFYGRGTSEGASQNATAPSGFRAVLLPTLSHHYREGGVEKYRVVHPTLLAQLLRGRFDVVVVEPFTNFPNDLQARAYAAVSGAAFVWSDVGEPPVVSRTRRMLQPAIKRLITGSHACIALNQVAMNDFLAAGVPPARVFLAPNAIDTVGIGTEAARLESERDAIRAKLGLAPSDFSALFIGAIERRKRVEVLLQAVCALREDDVRLSAIVVGDGAHLSDLRASLPESAKGHVRFEGSHYSDAAQYFVASDVVVLPGQGGLSINQALACGKPCIATREAVGGGDTVTDYVDNGVNGLLVEAGDVAAMANALRSLVVDPQYYERLLDGARACCSDHSLATMVRGFERAILYAADNRQTHR